jgi:hypothetical protein
MARRKQFVTPEILEICKDEIDRILAEKEAAIAAWADRIRQDIVIPACEQYGLAYIAGNGGYFFYDPALPDYSTKPRARIATKQDAIDAKIPALGSVFDVLDLDLDTAGRAQIGHYVEGVKIR